jgi:putative ABC transport system permease protein
MVGRLRPGIGVEQSQAALTTLASNLQQEHPDSNDTAGFTVVEANRDRFMGDLEESISVASGFLMIVVGLVLLIACSNVAHLLMARAVGRQREVAMKLALGSGRRRIVRQFVTETVLLSLLAGAVGLLLAAWTIELIFLAHVPTQIPITFDVALDWTVFGYTAAVSFITGVVIGLVPAFRIRDITLFAALKDQGSGRDPSTRAFGLRNALVIGQVALSFVLLIATGLILKNLYNLIDVDPGFEVGNVLVLDVNLSHGQYDEVESKAFNRRLVERVEQLPGVQSAGLAYVTPFSLMSDTYSVSVEGYEPVEGENMTFYGNIVDPRFFETLGIPIVQGRGFVERDREDTLPVVVINQTMAERFWPGKEPIGARVRTRGEWHRIIGVARDMKYRDLDEPPQPYIYLALGQRHVSMSTLHVRTAGDPKLLASAVQHEVEALDPNLPVWIRPSSEQMAYTLYGPVMLAVGIGCFGLLALVLALVGIYGVMSYSVRQRTREIGIRTALGAGRREIIRLVLRRGLAVTLVGLGLGLVGAFAVTRLFSSLLFQVSALDPVVFIGVSVTLAVAAFLACFLPARWAARIDPTMALHYE